MVLVLKTSELERVPRVRISHPPQSKLIQVRELEAGPYGLTAVNVRHLLFWRYGRVVRQRFAKP